MKRNRVVSVLLGMLLLFAFVSCDDATPAAGNDLKVSQYKQVTLSDLKPFASPNEEGVVIPEFSDENIDLELSMLEDAKNMLMETLLYLGSSFSNFLPFGPKSISAGFHLLINDESFSVEQEYSTDKMINIEHLGLMLEGNISSLSSLLEFLDSSEDEFASVISADGRVVISGKIRSIENVEPYTPPVSRNLTNQEQMELVTVGSLFLDLGISGSDLVSEAPSGMISGEFQLSIGSNFVEEWIPSSHSEFYYCPVVLQIAMKPFKNVNLAALMEVFNPEEEADPSSEPNWPALKELLWPGATGNQLTVTRIIGNDVSTSINKTKTWTDQEAFDLLFPLYNPSPVF